MTKMTLQELKNLYQPYVHGQPKKAATRKEAQHQHNKTWKPAKPEISPRAWHHLQRNKKSK